MKKKKPIRLLVCGSRCLIDFDFVRRKLDHLTKNLDLKRLIIVHGGAKGTDKLAGDWCFKRWVTQEIHHPDWKKYGHGAGKRRNAEMVKVADMAVAFWDGQSPGTEHCIETARKHGLDIRVILFESE